MARSVQEWSTSWLVFLQEIWVVFYHMASLADIPVAQKSYRLSEVEGLLGLIPEAVLVVAPDGRIAFLNPCAETLLGYTRQELTGRPLGDLVPDRYHEKLAQHIERPTGSGIHLVVQRKDGEERPVDIAFGPIEIDTLSHVIATLHDATEQRLAFAELEERKEDCRNCLSNKVNGFWRVAFDHPIPLDLPEMEIVERVLRDGYLTDTNLLTSQQYGFSEEGAMDGVRLETILSREDPETIPVLLEIVRSGYCMENAISFEKDRHGCEIVLENCLAGEMEEGLLKSVRGISQDITEQHVAAHEAHIKSAVLDTMLDGCLVVDATADDFPIIFVNDEFIKLTGYTRDETLGQNPRFLLGPKTDPRTVEKIRHAVQHAIPFKGTLLNYRKDGTEFWVTQRIMPVRDRLGQVTRLVGSFHDCTEERKQTLYLTELRQSLEHLSRTATLGELTTVIAHEINQPLTAISANVAAARRFIAADPPDLQEISEILEDIAADNKRSADVIRGLRRLMNNDELVAEAVDLNEIIQETGVLIRSDFLVKHVAFETDLAHGLPPVQGNRVQLQQVVLNLILNACEAVEALEPARRKIEVHTSHDPEHGVQIAVRDYGCGFSEQHKAKLFERFFSTKKTGLGMGLAITRTIIQRHGGRLWAENNPDHGATFSFALPVAGEDNEC